MSFKECSRRNAVQAIAALLGATIVGCRQNNQVKDKESPEKIPVSQETPRMTVPVSRVGWEVIASGEAGPGVRSRHVLVYDRRAKAAVLFGGVVWDPDWNLQSDTWELHGREWTQIRTSETPPTCHRGAMVHLDNSGRSLLFGGQAVTNEFLGETWTYSDRRWRKLKTGMITPPPRCGHCMAFDEEAGVAVLFGGVGNDSNSLGDTWVFDGSFWKAIRSTSPPARRYAALAYDPDLRGCLLHGGSDDESGQRSFGDTWLFRDNTWTQLDTNFDTDPRDDHGLGYHRVAKRMVMLEGVAGKRGILVRETTGWQGVEADPIHPRHQCSPLAWDSDLGGLLLHGGEARHQGPQFDTTLLLRMPSAS